MIPAIISAVAFTVSTLVVRLVRRWWRATHVTQRICPSCGGYSPPGVKICIAYGCWRNNNPSPVK